MANTLSTDQLLATSLELAQQESWSNVRLLDIAEQLEIPLQELATLVRQKDDIAELLFDKADRAIFARAAEEDFSELSVKLRLFALITAWLETLLPHRRAVRSMLCYKAEIGHLHLQAHGITRISRTVQWFMEVAGVRSSGLRRALEETLLTTIYLSCVTTWLRETGTRQDQSMQVLRRALDTAEKMARFTGAA